MCAVRVTLCVSGIVRAVHQSSSKLGDTPLVRLDLFESLPSRRFGCRASTTNSTTKSRSTSLYNGGAVSRGGCRALQLYSAPERSTSLQLYSALHSTSSTPSLRIVGAAPLGACACPACPPAKAGAKANSTAKAGARAKSTAWLVPRLLTPKRLRLPYGSFAQFCERGS